MEMLIFPDHPESTMIAGLQPSFGSARILRHASGRPWIVGRWRDDDLVHVRAGNHGLAIFGRTEADPEELSARFAKAGTAHNLTFLAQRLPGSFHLIASMDGEVRAQGSISTACQLFHTKVAGISVAADRPESLAAMAGADIALDHLGLRLLSPYGPPWPLYDTPVWQGVCATPVGHYLHLRQNGSAETVG